MVLDTSRYDAAYFGDTIESGGLRDINGYTSYLERIKKNRFDEGQESFPYNSQVHDLLTKFESINLSNFTFLDIGGAVGWLGDYLKNKRNALSYDVLDVSNWCFRNKVPEVDNFIEGDARTVLPTLGRNAYDVIISTQFLECIDDADLPDLIDNMNRVAQRQQIHMITETFTDLQVRTNYNVKTLQEWSLLGFENQTRLVSWNTGQVLVV